MLDALADHPNDGLRLTDVVQETGLGKATLHRILAGLVESELVSHDPVSGRFFIGLRIMKWAAAGRKRYGLVKQMKPTLQAICTKSEDTVYLATRLGDEAVYVDRQEGSYPLKALPVEVGARRPLGIGAAPLAILAFQPDAERDRIVSTYKQDRRAFGITQAKLASLIETARQLGYALHDEEITPGMIAIGIPVRDTSGTPIAAISVAASKDRLASARRADVAQLIGDEIAKKEIYVP